MYAREGNIQGAGLDWNAGLVLLAVWYWQMVGFLFF